MTAGNLFDAAFDALPAMVILRGSEPEETVRLCERAAQLGVRLVEVPLQSPRSRDSLAAAVVWAQDHPEITIGVGTIISPELVREAHELGARFTVAPGFDPDVLAESRRLGCPHLPGVATGSEIQYALRNGCTWLKAFPAVALGLPWFAAMRGPFPQVRLVATGGVDAAIAADLLRTGAAAVAFGSSFARLDPMDVARALQPALAGPEPGSVMETRV